MERPAWGWRPVVWTAVAFVIAAGGAGAARAVTGDLVEMEVLGVVPMESESASLLVLRQKGARTVLPVFVGRQEGNDIDLRLKSLEPAAHGKRHDLLRKSIEALGGKVTRVVIEGTQATLFIARVTLEQGNKRVDVDGRPSDSVALALSARAPIYAARTLVREAGLTEQDLGKVRDPGKRTASGADDDPASSVVSF